MILNTSEKRIEHEVVSKKLLAGKTQRTKQRQFHELNASIFSW